MGGAIFEASCQLQSDPCTVLLAPPRSASPSWKTSFCSSSPSILLDISLFDSILQMAR